jgi:flagellar basal-body rod modification protein FlgD
MGSVLANLAMSTLMPTASSSQTKSASTKAHAADSSNSSSSSSSASGLGTTFLSLLAQELQNQDPTAPVDPTAMVGQMISLNQLEQLIGINEAVNPSTTTTTGGSKAGAVQAATSSTAGVNSTLSPSAAGAASNQLPFDPSTMMPLGTGNAAALAASFNSSINAATLGLSGPSNYATGGK